MKFKKNIISSVGTVAFWMAHLSLRGDDLITDWDQFAKEFRDSPPSILQFSNDSPHFRALLASRNVGAFTEMVAQGKPVLVRIVGFEGLMSLDQQRGVECALKIALSEDVGYFLAPAYRAITDFASNTNFDSILTDALRTTPFRFDSANGLILQLPIKHLQSWYENPKRGWVFPSYEAIVLGRLYAEFDRANKSPTEMMKRALNSFAEIPGEPRRLFLVRGQETSPGYKEAMTRALADSSLSDTQIRLLVYSKSAYIANKIEVSTLNISDERRSALQSSLEQVKK
jgi:hypothetical protein